jgi:hypothetical protein
LFRLVYLSDMGPKRIRVNYIPTKPDAGAYRDLLRLMATWIDKGREKVRRAQQAQQGNVPSSQNPAEPPAP